VPASSIDWNAKPRLWQPTVLGGDEGTPKPAIVPPTGAPGQCQVAATKAAPAAAAAAAAAPAAKAKAASGAAGRAAGALAAAVAAVAAVAVL
jgi:hypothetical protein